MTTTIMQMRNYKYRIVYRGVERPERFDTLHEAHCFVAMLEEDEGL